MAERKTSDAQMRAVQKYKEKTKGSVKRLTLDFAPSENALWEQIQAQPKKQTYIKDLIRADMQKGN